MEQKTQNIIVAALYRFADIPEFKDWQAPLINLCHKHNVKGTLLLASEGINGTIAGSREGIDAVMAHLWADERMNGMEYKESTADFNPFIRMKVRLKKEIVTLGVGDVDVLGMPGTHLSPKEWDKMITDPDTIVVDTRNTYETAIGTFKNAIDPNTTNFREFPEFVKKNLNDKKDKNIAMFCTGGIRCEKVTAYMKAEGFENVYQLDGGILNYMETTPKEQSTWQGDCFVFDDRVSVTHDMTPGDYDMCHGCRQPITNKDKESNKYERGVTCPHCFDHISDDKKTRARERQKQVDLASKRGTTHIGPEIDTDTLETL